MMFCAKCHGALLKYERNTIYLLICLCNIIPKVVLYREVYFTRE